MLCDAGAVDLAPLGRGIEQAHRQLDHPHAVGDGVVCSQDDGAAPPVAVDLDRPPQRLVMLEHLGTVAGGESLQFTGVVGVLQVETVTCTPKSKRRPAATTTSRSVVDARLRNTG